MGRLTPTLVLETLPGEKFDLGSTNFIRLMPMLSPVMHRVRASVHTFFCPSRILFPEWQDFIFNPDTSIESPYILITEPIPVGSLADYMGIPPGDYSNVTPDTRINLLPFIAYCKIWDEYYRQVGIQDPISPAVVPGDNTLLWLPILVAPPPFAAWEKDYFTSCLPTPQLGADGIQIPLTFQENVPVELIDDLTDQTSGFVHQDGSNSELGNINIGTGPVPFIRSTKDGDGDPAIYDPRGTLKVDVQSEAALITDLRRAFRLQEFLEKLIVGGQRYIESLLSIFGVHSSDRTLQRPEYIYGDKQNVVMSEVLATTTSSGQPLGRMGGHGISIGGGKRGHYKCEEHGYIISMIVVRPDSNYQDGLHKMFSRAVPLDYAIPDFALIGEQAVLRKELQAVVGAGVDPNAVFGYQKRYAEYMFMNSRSAGQMRDTLDYWTLTRKFDDPAAPPALNSAFIECNPDTRIFAVVDPEEDHMVAHIIHTISAVRPLPRHGIPTI